MHGDPIVGLKLKPGESFRKGIRRTVRKQLTEILDSVGAANDSDRDGVVHEARKSFKKLRAILRLVRPAIGEKAYRTENVRFRDAARPLTEVRDAKILIETLDALAHHFHDRVASQAYEGLHRGLEDNLHSVRKRVLDEQDAFAATHAVVQIALDRVNDWADVPNRWSSVGQGLEDTHRRARAAFETAASNPAVDRLHEWRKQSKYLRYQLAILRPIWPERLGELTDEADKMGGILGDDHDLAVLWQMITDKAHDLVEETDRALLLALIARRRTELEQDAMILGERFFEDRPRPFARRLKGYWKTWQAAISNEEATDPRATLPYQPD